MTKQEAIEAMKGGKKVTHRYFLPHEWITQSGMTITNSDGYKQYDTEFWLYHQAESWETDWEEFSN